ncbi:SDR family NAD(P)-dependent oxidoreductase [Desertihabitans brevis]|uniref:SDR family NAD(P)-dependent oxidoreductase n=1 Tax=Desertihabitans brevis TaxID=2268447 RepID=A0A367YT79_9ACTN|nr:SDR family NAD(P)-dependent oxidoreductase [Desertihabitans brevis]RCK68191.1 SDR family NAD(P)-dependent oxidoreductase [Desertihabitans brevis]
MDTAPLALVTGASSGIGRELATVLAENGFDLVVNAEDAGLDAAAEQLRATGADVTAVRADLRSPEEVRRLHAAVTGTGRPLDVAALNAGVGRGGAFVETDLEQELAVIETNITATVHLAKLVLREMVARDEGRVLITSSIASTMPGSFQAVYNASKSFLQSFAEALVDELKDSGVTVTSLMPGPTSTNFFSRAGMDDTPIGQSASQDDPRRVAEQGVAALLAGKQKVTGGSVGTKLQQATSGLLPDRLKAALHRRMAEPIDRD